MEKLHASLPGLEHLVLDQVTLYNDDSISNMIDISTETKTLCSFSLHQFYLLDPTEGTESICNGYITLARATKTYKSSSLPLMTKMCMLIMAE